jgi:prepilin-type processing-associated H-X9-DG protein
MGAGWQGGGNDYGGCAGRVMGWAWTTSDHSHPMTVTSSVVDAGKNGTYDPPGYTLLAAGSVLGDATGVSNFKSSDSATKRKGIFFQPNESTGFQSIVDGTSNTLMVGELQRIPTPSTTVFNSTSGPEYTSDGWPFGGDATSFSTACYASATGAPQTLMNNGDFRSPGSEHSGTVNFGLADGSVRSLSVSMDATIFQFLGSMADRIPAAMP